MTDFYLKQGDLEQSLQFKLTTTQGIVDLSTAVSIKFFMSEKRNHFSKKIDNQSMSIVDAPNGLVQYQWQTGDTDIVGEYDAEVEVTFSDGKIQTFPSTGYIDIIIESNLRS